MTVIDWLVVVLIVAPAIPVLTLLVMLYRRVWRYTSPSLRERAVLALRDSIVASVAALLALQRLGFVHLPEGAAVPMLAVAMLLVSLPSAVWLILYWRGAFR